MITVRADDIAPRPWANGGGRTRELLTGGTPWRWRLSLAELDTDAPFSALPGVRRWFALVEGGPVELVFGQRVERLNAGDAPIEFDGADAPHCRVAAPARALNLMLRGTTGRLALAPMAAAQRGCYEPGTRTLHWDTSDGAARGVWIAVHDGDTR